jgi:hypothetical protein
MNNALIQDSCIKRISTKRILYNIQVDVPYDNDNANTKRILYNIHVDVPYDNDNANTKRILYNIQ